MLNIPEGEHAVFTVRPAPHEQDRDRSAWRARHAAETVGFLYAWFETAGTSAPLVTSAGTYRVHVPAPGTVDRVREMLADHEGMTIVSEASEPGAGLIEAY